MLRDIDRAPLTAAPPVTAPRAGTGGIAGADTTLAAQVRQTLTELARHSPGYAELFADRAGARLAYHVSAGQIAQLSVDGRAAMRAVYVGMQAALTVPPGLDTNALRARLVRAHGSPANGAHSTM